MSPKMPDPSKNRPTSRARGLGLRRGLTVASLVLAGLNAWWAWGDWPSPSMKTIEALIARGRTVEAERDLAERLRRSRNDGDARMKRARLLVRRGDTLGGALELHQVPDWWPIRGEASFLEGQSFKRAGRARDAEAAWKACLADDPLHPLPSTMFHGAAKELVTLYVLEGRLDEARAVLWRAYDEATPVERPGLLATRVRLELERIDHAEAVERLRFYLKADPDDLDARRALGVEEHATGDEAASDRDLETCLKARPDDLPTWRAVLDIRQERGDADGFSEAIARLPKTFGGDARLCLYEAIARQRSGDAAGALAGFRRAAVLAPNDPEILYKLGQAELAEGLAEQGRSHVVRTREIHAASEALKDDYQAILEQLARSPRDEAGYRSAIQRVAATCRTLGWTREADAWLALIPPG